MQLDPTDLPLADARLDDCAASNARYVLREIVDEEDGEQERTSGE